MSEQFEVGQWVWVWLQHRWLKIQKAGVDYWVLSDGNRARPEYLCGDPHALPPKPRRTVVTKEARICENAWANMHSPRYGKEMCPTLHDQHWMYHMPCNATNIKPPTYDIEEEEDR